jgi:hypothetical protein
MGTFNKHDGFALTCVISPSPIQVCGNQQQGLPSSGIWEQSGVVSGCTTVSLLTSANGRKGWCLSSRAAGSGAGLRDKSDLGQPGSTRGGGSTGGNTAGITSSQTRSTGVGRTVVCTRKGYIQLVVGEAIPGVVKETVGETRRWLFLYGQLMTSRSCPGIPWANEQEELPGSSKRDEPKKRAQRPHQALCR